MFDDTKRLDALEAKLADLNKAYSTSVEAINKNFKEVADKRQSLVDQLNDFLKIHNKSIEDLEKANADLDGTVKKLQQRVATLDADMKKVRK